MLDIAAREERESTKRGVAKTKRRTLSMKSALAALDAVSAYSVADLEAQGAHIQGRLNETRFFRLTSRQFK